MIDQKLNFSFLWRVQRDLAPGESLDPRKLPAGTKLRSYSIRERIGEGGFGTVYRANDLELDRDVAVKVADIDQNPEEQRLRCLRFQREKRVTVKLRSLLHMPVPEIYTAGIDGDLHWYAMEYIEGGGPDHGLDPCRHPKHLERLCRRFAALADDLHRAHQEGVIHRDLKPANLRFRHRDGKIYILDWGLGREVDEDDIGWQFSSKTDLTNPLTQAGMCPGTCGFIAPEVSTGERGDPQADIFALGVILYQLFATSEDPLSAGQVDPRPLRRKAVPEQLERIILKAMAHDRADRYVTAAELAKDLRRFSEPEQHTGLDYPSGYSRTVARRRQILANRLSEGRHQVPDEVIERKSCADALRGGKDGTALWWEAEVLLLGIDAGCVKELREAGTDIKWDIQQKCVKRLQEFSENLNNDEAWWAVKTWCKALGLSMERPEVMERPGVSERKDPLLQFGCLLLSILQMGILFLLAWLFPPEHYIQFDFQGAQILTFTPDRQNLLTGTEEGKVYLTSVTGDGSRTELPSHATAIKAVACSSDGSRYASASGRWRSSECGVAVGRDGRLLAEDCVLHVSDGFHKTDWAFSLPCPPRAVVFTPGRSDQLWVAGADDIVRLLDLHTGKWLKTLEGVRLGPDSCRALAVGSTTSGVLAAGGLYGLRIWKIGNDDPPAVFPDQPSPVNALAITPDGKQVFTGSDDGKVRVYDTATEIVLSTLSAHRGAAQSLAAFPDNRRLASGGADGRVRVWEWASGKLLREYWHGADRHSFDGPGPTLSTHHDVGPAPVPAVAVSSDGLRVASVGWKGTVRVWFAPP